MSNGHHWSKFWWKDWQAEPSLRRCSIAARGLWMELLCIAHSGEPYGHLRENGRDLTAKDLTAMIANISLKEVTKLLAELEAQGVFSRTEGGTIYNRRMQKDATQSDAGRQFVERRWGANGAPHPNRGAIRSPTSKPNRGATRDPIAPEARSTEAVEAKKEREVYINTNLSSELPGACARTDAPVGTVELPRETVATLIAVETITEKVGRKMRNVEFVGAFPRHSREVQIEAYARWTAPRPATHHINPELLRSMPHRQRAMAAAGRH